MHSTLARVRDPRHRDVRAFGKCTLSVIRSLVEELHDPAGAKRAKGAEVAGRNLRSADSLITAKYLITFSLLLLHPVGFSSPLSPQIFVI